MAKNKKQPEQTQEEKQEAFIEGGGYIPPTIPPHIPSTIPPSIPPSTSADPIGDLVLVLEKAVKAGVFSDDIKDKFTLAQHREVKKVAILLMEVLDIEQSIAGIKKHYQDPVMVRNMVELLKLKV